MTPLLVLWKPNCQASSVVRSCTCWSRTTSPGLVALHSVSDIQVMRSTRLQRISSLVDRLRRHPMRKVFEWYPHAIVRRRTRGSEELIWLSEALIRSKFKLAFWSDYSLHELTCSSSIHAVQTMGRTWIRG